ncbi:hypothetical protein [Streptomyces sp. KR55]
MECKTGACPAKGGPGIVATFVFNPDAVDVCEVMDDDAVRLVTDA